MFSLHPPMLLVSKLDLCCQVSLLMGIFTILAVPETRGKSLAEIQTMFGELEPRGGPVVTISGEIDKEK